MSAALLDALLPGLPRLPLPLETFLLVKTLKGGVLVPFVIGVYRELDRGL